MKSRRYGALAVLVTCMILAAAFAASRPSTAQQKPEDKPTQPAEKKDLLTVEPAVTKTPPGTAPQKPDTKIQLPGGEADDKNPIITNTDLITFTVTVTDIYGRFVSGLGKKAFSIFDDKTQQEISFFSDDDAPVSVGIVFDLTGSMSGEKVRRAREALAHFIQTSHEMDEYFLVTLQNGRTYLALDHTRDGNGILDKLTFVQTKGNTAFYDSVYLAAERVQRGANPKRAVLVISDGQDNNSRYTFNDLRKALRESDVAVYAIGIEESGNGSLAMEGSGILDEIAAVSGGKAFFPRSAAEMDDIFEQIALELRHQYSIGYRPPNFVSDGKWHRIKVKVAPPRGLPRLFVRSKEGYFAIANPK
jgi:Ca-activated chloride channel family protein